MATKNGTVKKTPLPEYSRPRNGGIIALNLNEGDELIGVDITDGEQEIMLFSDAGKVVRFREDQVRSMGRTAYRCTWYTPGRRSERVVSLIVPGSYEDQEAAILTVTENGFGKRTPVGDYPTKSPQPRALFRSKSVSVTAVWSALWK